MLEEEPLMLMEDPGITGQESAYGIIQPELKSIPEGISGMFHTV